MRNTAKNIKFLLGNLVFFAVCLSLFWSSLPKDFLTKSSKSTSSQLSSYAVGQLAEEIPEEDSESEDAEFSALLPKELLIIISSYAGKYSNFISGFLFYLSIPTSPPNS